MRAHQRHRFRHRYALETIVLSLAIWGVLLLITLLHGEARWPSAGYDVTTRDIRAPFDISVQRGDVLIPAGTRIPSALGTTERWIVFLVIAGVIEFLLIKVYAMARRHHLAPAGPGVRWYARVDWLTISLIAANASFLYFYFYTETVSLYPGWSFTSFIGRLLIYVPIAALNAWAAVSLLRVPDEADAVDDDFLALLHEVEDLKTKNEALTIECAQLRVLLGQ